MGAVSLRWQVEGGTLHTEGVKTAKFYSTLSRTIFTIEEGVLSLHSICIEGLGKKTAWDTQPGCTLTGPYYFKNVFLYLILLTTFKILREGTA